jgi:hypothetical protein
MSPLDGCHEAVPRIITDDNATGSPARKRRSWAELWQAITHEARTSAEPEPGDEAEEEAA